MKEAKDTITMERVTLEINNQGQWQVTSAERWPLLGGILRTIIAGLLAISAVLTAITVLVMSWVVIASGITITDSDANQAVNIFTLFMLILPCIIAVFVGIMVAKGVDIVCCRESFTATYATILGLSPVLLAIYAINFFGPMSDVTLYLKAMIRRVSLEYFLCGTLAYIWVNGIAVLLAFAYKKICIQKPVEADHEETESEIETEVEG